MTINKADISNTSTFGTWKTRTNELLAFARKTVSLGTSGENNDGDLVLNGDLTLGSVNPTTDTLTVNNISKCATGDLKILNDIEVEGTLILDTGAGQVSKLQFNNGGAITWAIETASDHSYLEIGDGTSFIRFQADGSGGKEIDGENIKINNDILPDEITAVNFTSTGTGADRSVLAEVNISAGTISGLTSLESASATLSTVDIEAGTIDNTAIGTTTQSTGKFTSVDTVSNGDFTVHGTGGFKGDLKNSAGGTVVDVDAATPVLYGQSSGLTNDALEDVLKAVYPIGSLYTTTTNVSPALARASDGSGGLGFGTWERYAEGRTLTGVDAEGSIGVVAGHTSEVSVTNNAFGRGYSSVFYLDNPNHGFQQGSYVDVNVGDNVTMDPFPPGVSLSDPYNPLVFTDTNGRGLKVIETGDASGQVETGVSAGTPYIRVDITPIVLTLGTIQRNWYPTTSFKNFQVGGVDLTSSNGMTIRHSAFRSLDSEGGWETVELTPHHMADHVHDTVSWDGIQYYLYNDGNEIPPDTTYQQRAQGPQGSNDGNLYRMTGGVAGYEVSSTAPQLGFSSADAGIKIIDRNRRIDGDGHTNLAPYVTVSIWKRTA